MIIGPKSKNRIINNSKFTFAYDGNGNRTVVQDLNTAWTTYTMDANNRLTSSETGILTFWTYDAANRLVTAVSSDLTTSYQYDRNGCEIGVQEGGGAVYTMGYDNMLRLNYQIATSTYNTFTYDAGGLKRYEYSSSGITTLIWDGDDYLGAKS